MATTLTRHADAVAFLAAAGSWLARDEAAHCLLLGLAAGLRDEPGRYDGAPYFAVVRDVAGAVVAAALRTSPAHNLILSRAPEAALPPVVADAHAVFPTLPGLLAPTEIAAPFAALWHGRTGQPYRRNVAERIHALTEVIPPRAVPGGARRATEADRELLVAWNLAFARDVDQRVDRAESVRAVDFRLRLAPETGGLWLWEDNGLPVSLAGYGGPTPHGIRIGPVYTPPAHRGKGYASANVAALSQWLLDGGRQFCGLFTDLANPTANKVYRQIGYRPVCDMDEYAFASAPANGGGGG